MRTTSRLRLCVELLEDRRTPSTVIATVPYVISAPGTYELTSNLYYGGISGNAITVQTQGVVINLNGHTLWSQTGPATMAVGIAANQESYISIENGTIQGFQFGIEVQGENRQGNQVRNMVLADNWYEGAYVEGIGTLVENNLVENTGYCDIPSYTIPIGIHVGGPQSEVLDNRVTGFLWYPGVTQEIVALAVDDAPGAVVKGNIFKESQYMPNSWGLWINSYDNDGNTTVDLEDNVFANLQFGSSFIYSEGQAQNNTYVNVVTPWNETSETGLTDLGGNVSFSAVDYSPGHEAQNATDVGFAESFHARALASHQESHLHSDNNDSLCTLTDKRMVETNRAGTRRYTFGPLANGVYGNLSADAESEIIANFDFSDDASHTVSASVVNIMTPAPASAGSRLYFESPIVRLLNNNSTPIPAVAATSGYLDQNAYPSSAGWDDKSLAVTALFENDWWYNFPTGVLASWSTDLSQSAGDGAHTPDGDKPTLPFADQSRDYGQFPEDASDLDDPTTDGMSGELKVIQPAPPLTPSISQSRPILPLMP